MATLRRSPIAFVAGALVALVLLTEGCSAPPETSRAPQAPQIPPPVPAGTTQALPAAADSVSAAATAVAAIPTQPPAPPARGAAITGRLLLATTRISPHPRSNLPMDYRLGVLSPRGLEIVPLPEDDRGVVDAAASRDGSKVAVIVGSSRILSFSVGRDSFIDVAPRLDPVSLTQTDLYLSVSWLGQRLLVRRPGPTGLTVIDLETASRDLLPATGMSPAVSPDGARLAVGLAEGQLFYSIHLTDLGFRAPRKLTTDTVTESSPAWSPDGQWIAYTANAGFTDRPRRTVAGEIRVIHPDGTAKRTLIPRKTGITYPDLRWSPDGRQIAFTRYDEPARTKKVGVVNADGTGEVMLSDNEANDRVLGWLP